MSHAFGTDLGGIRSVNDLKLRCFVIGTTGCWEWRGAYSVGKSGRTPTAAVAGGVFGPKPKQMTAHKAAWLLRGSALEPGHVVYRKCANLECCNPGHLAAGPRREMHRCYVDAGRYKTNPERRVINLRNRLKMVTPVDKVREVESMVDAGMRQKDIVAACGLDKETVRSIRDGRHVHSRTRVLLTPGASVFAWGQAA